MTHNTFRIRDLVEANHCIRDLVALSTLPAIWAGGDVQRVARGVGDALFGMLRPTMVYVGIKDEAGTVATEVARSATGWLAPADTEEAARLLGPWLKLHAASEARVIHNPLGAGMARVLVVPIGLDARFGLIAAVSQLVNFPNEVERLLLNVAANQAAIAVQNVQLMAAIAKSHSHAQATLGLKERVRKLLHDEASDIARMRADLTELLASGDGDEAQKA